MSALGADAAPLIWAALTVALVHTLIGVDHYLPFVVLGRARRWSMRKVLGVTALCGLGHVTGSVVLGFVGIGLGAAVGKLEWIESVRGTLAAWGLIAFGLVYMAWATLRLLRGQTHTHAHVHDPPHGSSDAPTEHRHSHSHEEEHLHPHGVSVSFWALFIVFALGPCEPLIPVLMAPAFDQNWALVAVVATVFSVTTITAMMGMAALGFLGLRMAPLRAAERYGNLAAGGAILASGLAIQLLGI